MARIHGCLAAIVVCFTMMTDSTTAFLYAVGGEAGWAVPNNNTFYQEWVKNKTFIVGDELIFMYSSGHNNVYRVNKKDYDDCNSNDPIEAYIKGPTALTLTAPGEYYYFSNIGRHCEFGMKVHITVADGQKLAPRQLMEVANSPSTAISPAPGPASEANGKRRGITIVFSLAITSMISLFV